MAENQPKKESDDPRRGLGIKRRSQPGESQEGLGEFGTKKEEGADEQAKKKPTGKLRPEHLQILVNFYQGRPEVEPPLFIDELEGTAGWFCGDGRPEREIVVGFRPAFVIFTAPPFPGEETRHWEGKEFYQPPLHDQPPYTDRGFVVDERFNKVGTISMYIVWRPASENTPPAPGGP
jgi:hypothetical protein